ncbi:hypothetical protein NEUTE1DRAFT_117005 [Neurospora tetrasperma FGSC 2508]|uniref:Transmembrane protein n=1 Tax=Neurospora tetrasperma (strain FGSC 2508 / ATCC MYA-4615 / P0657) TaxID=510951 RepID=F8MMS7_NEUT8|nr:uncharacterized protein NEUTE1DRAFT_117005 [Neurospora tetrasperma FGSC 2508]EGO57951.1 hypothetical protein NEUTE1DRAFT_117005 [Neurospora tetrasperma FGSC 2508]EGZ71754.1 hypothetical protein NEUTE2DRAFT_144603 [Neurospora tetrasperma FGSC 2509]
MAPTSSTTGLILPRDACQSRYGCGTIHSDKLPLLITVAVVVAIIIVTIYWCSFRSLRAQKRKRRIKNTELPSSTAPHAVREVPTPTTLGAGPTGAGTGAGGSGATETGAVAAATATAGEAGETGGTTWQVPTSGLNPLVPPPMYEETPLPPPTYQRDAQAPRYA